MNCDHRELLPNGLQDLTVELVAGHAYDVHIGSSSSEKEVNEVKTNSYSNYSISLLLPHAFRVDIMDASDKIYMISKIIGAWMKMVVSIQFSSMLTGERGSTHD